MIELTKIVIDTNIFLGLYESDNDTLRIFEDIEKLQPHLIMSDQSFEEFLRNRDKLLQKLIKEIKRTTNINPYFCSLIRDSTHFKNILSLKEQFKEHSGKLIKEIQTMLDTPEKDPIYIKFNKIFNSTEVVKLFRTDEIIDKAYRRKLIGNPPMSVGKNSIGDEILWELLINSIDEDLLIVTRDKTYNVYRSFLKNEYNKKTNRRLCRKPTISEEKQ